MSGRDEAALRAQASGMPTGCRASPEPMVSCAGDGGVASDALCGTGVGFGAGCGGGDGGAARAGRGRPHGAVSLGRRASGVSGVRVPRTGQSVALDGSALLAELPVFAETVAACEAALSRHTDWSLTAVLRGDEGAEVPPLERVDVVQPALFAMKVALAAVWRSLGLEPAAVVGHSQGEIAAAVVAGMLSLEDGARVVALRSQLLRRVSGSGGMAVTELPVEAVEERLQQSEWSGLSMAVVNTPSSTVVSGPSEAVERWCSGSARKGCSAAG